MAIALLNYVSPATERSVFKNIPISELETVRNWIKTSTSVKNYRFRFRGPRPSARYKSYLTKNLAKTFAVYLYN